MATYNPIARPSFTTTSFSYIGLLSDGSDVVSRSGTVASGIGILKRGAILKCDPATGVITVPAAAADCNCILADDVDATAATVAALVYLSGKFKADAIVWPGALGHGVVSDALRDFGILIESVVFSDGTLVKSVPLQAEAEAAMAIVEHNREELSRTGTPTGPPEQKPTADSPWAYLTPEERERHPELAHVPTTDEIAGSIPDVPGVTISPGSANVGAGGGNGTVTVTINSPGASGTWTVDPEASATWLTHTPTTPQSADGSVTWTAAINETGAARVGHLYINGKTFTLNQAGF
jgi:hypothetical protein